MLLFGDAYNAVHNVSTHLPLVYEIGELIYNILVK